MLNIIQQFEIMRKHPEIVTRCKITVRNFNYFCYKSSYWKRCWHGN